MITLPRSPVIKLLVGLLVIICLFAIGYRNQPALDKDSWVTPGRSWRYEDHTPAEASKERPPPRSFKVPESLHLTHDVAIPHDVPPWTQEDTDFLDTTIGFNLKTQLLKQDYGKDENLKDHPERINFAELSRAERLYKALWNHVYPTFQGLSGRNDREREKALVELAKTRPEIDFFLRLEKRLFPWVQYARLSSFSLYRTFKGRGLIFCAGNPQFEFVVTSIQAIRSRLKSELPIQVFHMGDDDLSKDRQQYLSEMTSNIEVLDVTQVLDNDYMKLGGWAIKPFAILASSFEEVMFVDADAYFLQDPAVLFEDPGYQATGALFFYDRTLFPNWDLGKNWLRSITPFLSSFPPKSRMFRLLTSHEQESGVVVINKRTRLMGLMAICKSNSKWERELVSYRIFHGDKETFWTGFELIQEPYVFMRNYGGVIGEMRPNDNHAVCGAQLHEDYQGRPLWWNGGLYRNKNEGVNRYLDFGYWMSGGGRQKHREWVTNDPEDMKEILREQGLRSADQLQLEPKDPEWIFKESCLAGGKVNTLTQRESDLANGFVKIDEVVRQDAEKIRTGQKVDPKSHAWDRI
ncbi:mannosyltransferase putative-domain-containing protein [Mortierella sp. GBAus27b]|nr:hypothetical protein BGX31_009105 [Mortierella sp. GBA43]KAI8360236.1 mannosyltransferase putative-domain-containing protein [Mortierella sp. GBAus27b]